MGAGAALGTAATVATIVAAAASVASIAYQASQGAPKMPDYASSSREVAQAQAAALPIQRGLSAAEQQGSKVLAPGITQTTYSAEQAAKARADLQNQINDLTVVRDRRVWNPDTKKYELKPVAKGLTPDMRKKVDALRANLDAIPEAGGTVYKDAKGKLVAPDKAYADFTGYGTADVEGKLAQQFADVQNELGKKYGVQFAEEAAHEAELADPQGTAARKLEYEMLQKQLSQPQPINPLATKLQDQISGQVKAGAGLDPMERDLLDASIAKANAARGGSTSAGDVAQEMSTGMSGQQRLGSALTKGQAFASSGSTPADIEFRREQQNLQNLGAFVNGATPESQFANLSSAGNGAAPFVPGNAQPQLPANAGAGGGAYSVAAYNAKTNSLANSANPWMAGISSLLQGVNAFAGAKGTG